MFCLFSTFFSLQERSTHLSELVQKSGSDSSIVQSPRFRLKPRPPGRCTGPLAQRVASCHCSSIKLDTGLKSPIYNSPPHLSPGQQVHITTTSFHPGPRVETSHSQTPSSSEPFRYCPTHRRVVSSFGTSRKNL